MISIILEFIALFFQIIYFISFGNSVDKLAIQVIYLNLALFCVWLSIIFRGQ
jgi:hypothetical protein